MTSSLLPFVLINLTDSILYKVLNAKNKRIIHVGLIQVNNLQNKIQNNPITIGYTYFGSTVDVLNYLAHKHNSV